MLRILRALRSLMIIIYYLLSIIYYLLSIIYYLLSIIYYLLSIIYYLLSIIYYLLSKYIPHHSPNEQQPDYGEDALVADAPLVCLAQTDAPADVAEGDEQQVESE